MIASSFVKKQLIAFTAAAVIAAFALGIVFLRVPEALGIGRYQVRAEFDKGAGLYEGSQVNFRGTPVGKVASMDLTAEGIEVVMTMDDSVAVPSDVTAEIHSTSAVGEQYVELVPSVGGPKNLADGDVITADRTSEAVEIGPVLDNVEALVSSLPPGDLDTLIRETSTAFDGRDRDLQQILDGTGNIVAAADANFEPTAKLIQDADPFLSIINAKGKNIRSFTTNLAQVTDELKAGDGDLSVLLNTGPQFASQTSGFVSDIEPILPGTLGSLNVISRVLARYQAYLAQLLTDYPKAVAAVQSVTLPEVGAHDVRLTLANVDKPAECLEGFLPVADWASPYDLSPRKLELFYCKLPSNDSRGVRGARNVPCADSPAIRRATPGECGE